MLDGSCIIRQQAKAALGREGILWKITFVGRSLSN